jgi:hypothetical protein
MSLLDGPFAFLSALDTGAARMAPEGVRLVLWALIAAIVSMELYRWLSPQARIKTMKVELQEAQRRLSGFDGEFSEGWPLVRRMLGLALTRVGLVLPATIAASLPLLVLILWLAVAYASREIVHAGPAWLRGWEPVFLVALLVCALAYKRLRGVE